MPPSLFGHSVSWLGLCPWDIIGHGCRFSRLLSQQNCSKTVRRDVCGDYGLQVEVKQSQYWTPCQLSLDSVERVSLRLTPHPSVLLHQHLTWSSVIDLGENLLSWLTIPCKRQISLILVGVANFAIAETLSGSAVIPRSSTTCPKYSADGWANVHFSEFSVMPISLGHYRKPVSISHRALLVSYHGQEYHPSDTPCLVAHSVLRLWQCSGADELPKGSRRKWKCPNGVINVVGSADSGERGICQNPKLASSFENNFASANCATVWSTAGSGWCSHLTISFNFVKSTQILMRECSSRVVPLQMQSGKIIFQNLQ